MWPALLSHWSTSRGPQVTLYHIDLYRIDTERELESLGLDDLLAPDCILLIEWEKNSHACNGTTAWESHWSGWRDTERRIRRIEL
jgi:tRNA A37 threonylcarbamoyladenosine biosynthesis protein TsaE